MDNSSSLTLRCALTESEMIVDAVFHNLVLVGEAGGIVMNEIARREREEGDPRAHNLTIGLDWEAVVVMRNNIIHKYFIFRESLTRRTRMKQALALVRRLVTRDRPTLLALRTLLQEEAV